MDRVKGNFVIQDGKHDYIKVHTIEKEAEPVSHTRDSTVKGIAEAEQYLFDSLWIKALPAEYRIRELEDGVVPDVVEILRDPYEIQRLAFRAQ